MQRIVCLFNRHKEAILYLFFGGLTTIVNYIVYIACFQLLPVTATTIPNIVAWIICVLFAYLTNRSFVFHSQASSHTAMLREIVSFAGARVFTLLLETGILWIAVDMMQLNNFVVKLAANLLVIVLNYVLSRFWIFKKK